MQNTDKPADILNIKVGEDHKHLVMSYGIINQLIGYIQTPLDLIKLPTNPDLQELFLYEILSERNEDGVITKNFNTFMLDPKTAADVIAWAAGHVNHFFIQTLEHQQSQFSKLIALTSQPSGQTGSPQ